MDLRYRGADYTTRANQVKTVSEVIGQYRGAVVSRHVVENVNSAHVEGLVYRGAKVR
ncbi:MAG: DUF4278 domain-containing protein [Cyanobacteria bacterium P01_C01_bin.120]